VATWLIFAIENIVSTWS